MVIHVDIYPEKGGLDTPRDNRFKHSLVHSPEGPRDQRTVTEKDEDRCKETIFDALLTPTTTHDNRVQIPTTAQYTRQSNSKLQLPNHRIRIRLSHTVVVRCYSVRNSICRKVGIIGRWYSLCSLYLARSYTRFRASDLYQGFPVLAESSAKKNWRRW